MPFSIVDILYGGAAPAVVACIVSMVLRRFAPQDVGKRYAASLAVLAGFALAYRLLDLGPWAASAHWEWLPYALIASALVGPIASTEGVKLWERLLLYAFVAIVTGWFLVPTWEDLDPSRAVHLGVLAAYLVLLAGLLEPLANRARGPLLLFVLWATLAATTAVLVLSGNLRFAQMALAGAAALFGVALVACVRRETNYTKGVSLIFSMMAVGLMLIGRVNSFSEVPLASYLLVPAAPLALWCSAVGPLSTLTGVKGVTVRVALPFSLLGVAVVLAICAEMSGAGEY